MSFYEHLIQSTALDRAQLLAVPAIADCLRGQVSREAYPRSHGKLNQEHTRALAEVASGAKSCN